MHELGKQRMCDEIYNSIDRYLNELYLKKHNFDGQRLGRSTSNTIEERTYYSNFIFIVNKEQHGDR